MKARLAALCLVAAACGSTGARTTPPPGAIIDGGAAAAAHAADAGAPLPDPGPLADDGLDLPPAAGFLKGQLHMHSIASGDSNVDGHRVVEFYHSRGYDFLVFTDHNVISRLAPSGDMLVFPGVELTRNTRDCQPPPEKVKCLVHVNALFVSSPAPDDEIVLGPAKSFARLDLYQHSIDRARALGGLPMVNHPNFQWGLDPASTMELGRRGVRLLEFANQGMPISNPGDATHASSEMLWDLVLTAGVDMWGVATDDAHDYDDATELAAAGETAVYPGDLGWVMVRAERDGAALRAALERGDFYASTGVLLAELAVVDGVLVVRAAGRGGFAVEFVGPFGQLLERQLGREGRFSLARAAGGYVRARVLGEGGKLAWTQPIRVP